MKPLWVVQKNLQTEAQIEQLTRAFQKTGLPALFVSIIPFSDDLPEIPPYDGPILAYGSTTLIKNIHRTNDPSVPNRRPAQMWKPGIFFHPEHFRFDRMTAYGENLLNHDARVMTLEQLKQETPERFFMRPNNDLKDFSGGVVSRENLWKWYDEVSAGGYLFDTNLEVVVAQPKVVDQEWRVFVVDGKPVTASQYRLKSMLHKKAGAPSEVLQFVEEMTKRYAPEPCFVMDVADYKGKLHVVELNCFNASGFYECDAAAAFGAASEYIEARA